MNNPNLNNPNLLPQNWSDVETLLGELREMTGNRDALVGKRDSKVADIAQHYAPDIDALTIRVDSLGKKIAEFVQAHHSEFGEPGTGGRFRDLEHGRVGFRSAPAHLETLRGLTFEQVVEYMLPHKRLSRFVRIKHELNRVAILSDMDKDVMEEVGVVAVASDNPFIDLKKG